MSPSHRPDARGVARGVALGVALSVLAPAAALAQSGPGSQDEPEAAAPAQQAESGQAPGPGDNTVRTDARAVEDPRLPSGFVTRVDISDTSPGEGGLTGALERAPGLYVRRQSSYGQPAYVQVRGGNPRQVVVLLNGVRVRVPSGLGFDVGSLSATGLDEARVFRGGAGMIYGAGALTGAVALRSAPEEDQGHRLSARATGGSFGTREVQVLAEDTSEELGAGRFAASWRQSEGDFAFVDEQGTRHVRLNNDHRRLHVLGSGAWYGAGRHLGGTILFDQGWSGVAGPSEFQRAYGRARFEERRLIVTTDATVRDILGGDGWTVDFARVFGMQWRDQRYANPEAVLGGGDYDARSTVINTEGGAEFSLYTQANNFARLRLESRREDYDGRQSATGLPGQLAATRSTQGVSLTDEQLLAGGRVSLIGVARAERIASERLERWRWPVTGALGAVWRARPWLRLATNAARTWRPPDFDELYLDTEFVRGDPGLDPERAWQTDVGARLGRARGPWRAEVVGFWGRTQDLITFLPVTAYLYRAANFATVTSRGVEASGDVALWPRLPVGVSYTFTDAWRQALPWAPLPNQPRHRLEWDAALNLRRIDWLGDWPRLRLEARAAWRSRIALDSFDSRSNPAWWRLDVGLVASPRTWLTGRCDLNNLLDYQRAVDGLQRPLPGRSLFCSIQLQRRRPQD